VTNPETVAITMVLDLVLHVEDRHKGNLISIVESDGRERLVAIDFEDALVGNPEAYGELDMALLPRWRWMPMVRHEDFDDLVDAAAASMARLTVDALTSDASAAEHAARISGAARRILPRLVERTQNAPALVDVMRRGGHHAEVEP